MKPGPSAAETAIAGAVLFLMMEAFLPKLLAPDPALGEESELLRLLWLPVYALIGIGAVLAWRRMGEATVRAPGLAVLCGLALLSVAWSTAPDATFRRAVALAATTGFGVYLAARFDWTAMLRLMGAVWGLAALLTLAAGVLAPDFARMQEVHVGAWSGGWWEKNQLGGHMARAGFLFAFLAWRDRPFRRAWTGLALVSLLLVVLSTSKTALLGLVFGLGVLGAAAAASRGPRLAAGVALGALLAAAAGFIALVEAPDLVFAALGRDATLTGRTDIWSLLAEAIAERPLLGHGYGAFWLKDADERLIISQLLEWDVPSGHSGWLDVAAGLGWVGVGVLAADLALLGARGAAASLRSPAGVFALGAVGQILIFGVSESLFLAQNSIVWATYAAISARLALDAADGGRPRAPASGAPRTRAPQRRARAA